MRYNLQESRRRTGESKKTKEDLWCRYMEDNPYYYRDLMEPCETDIGGVLELWAAVIEMAKIDAKKELAHITILKERTPVAVQFLSSEWVQYLKEFALDMHRRSYEPKPIREEWD